MLVRIREYIRCTYVCNARECDYINVIKNKKL